MREDLYFFAFVEKKVFSFYPPLTFYIFVIQELRCITESRIFL